MGFELKLAILRAGKTQRQVSVAAEIPETRLSAIVHGRVTARRVGNEARNVMAPTEF